MTDSCAGVPSRGALRCSRSGRPFAFTLHRPAGEALPLVLDSPHSGEFYPDDFDHAPPREVVRQAEDTHVGRLYGRAPALGAVLLEARFPRAYIDANRSLIGLVWRLARDGSPMYGRRLTAAEVAGRIDRWYRPYHAALDAELDRLHRAFGAVWLIDCHSMPAVGDERSDDPGRERADFVLGDRDGTTCAPEFTAFVAATLAGMGYRVAVNDPYKGVEIVRRHGRPAERRHSLQVEVKRTLYMDEATLVPNAGYARLEADLARLVAAVGTHVRGQLAG